MTGPYWYINLVEAALWICAGAAVLLWSLLRGQWGARPLMRAAFLIAFGQSDVVETHNGAWWRPWWLLVWKGLCVLALCCLLLSMPRRSL